jgi:hypothetical protein
VAVAFQARCADRVPEPIRTKPIYQDNRYGAAGGALCISGVYNGRNKTFWFFTWEANKFGDPNVGASTSTVPRDAWRNGNLSDLLALGPNYQIYDPFTIAPAAGGRFSRQPVPGNIIPASQINAVGKALLNLYPSPNSPATQTADGRTNYFLSGKALEDYWTTLGRFDHAFSDKHRMFVRFHRDWWEEDKNRSFGNDERDYSEPDESWSGDGPGVRVQSSLLLNSDTGSQQDFRNDGF